MAQSREKSLSMTEDMTEINETNWVDCECFCSSVKKRKHRFKPNFSNVKKRNQLKTENSNLYNENIKYFSECEKKNSIIAALQKENEELRNTNAIARDTEEANNNDNKLLKTKSFNLLVINYRMKSERECSENT